MLVPLAARKLAERGQEQPQSEFWALSSLMFSAPDLLIAPVQEVFTALWPPLVIKENGYKW